MHPLEQITIAPTFSAWQNAARRALAQDLAPDEIAWEELGSDQPALAFFDEVNAAPVAGRARVPRAFVEMAERVSCHRDARRWALLYRVLWRLTHGEPRLLEIAVDPDMHALQQMDKAVRHDMHKMRAFVRFRAVPHEGGTWYVAWFEPQHHIVERNAPFFRDRFAGMQWSILTPDRCAHWDCAALTFTAGVPRSEAPAADAMEDLWRTYYGHIFNPARVKTKAMQAEMPKRYWKNLPEAEIIPALLEQAPRRVEAMLAASDTRAAEADEYSIAEPPDTHDLDELREAASACRVCPLWRHATQTVFGEGDPHAPLVFVGEQPGDQEDLQGRPFVGPAGQLFDRALAEAGIDRRTAYVTNTVKHFKWEPRGKRRLHQKPSARDIAACRPWLAAELRILQPRVLVALGATAASALLSPGIRVLRDRGQMRESEFCQRTLVTVHPSSLLRAPDETARAAAYATFVADLRLVAMAM